MSASGTPREPLYVVAKVDYRAIRLVHTPWTPLKLWGTDFFVWHIPLLKTTLVLDALIVWWLS